MVYLRRTRRPKCQGRHAPLRPFWTEGSAESSGSTRPAARSSSGTKRGGGGLPPPSHFLFFGFFEPRHAQWPAPPTYFVELPPPRGGRIASCCPLPVMWYMVAGPAANHNPDGGFFRGNFPRPTRPHTGAPAPAPARPRTRPHTGAHGPKTGDARPRRGGPSVGHAVAYNVCHDSWIPAPDRIARVPHLSVIDPHPADTGVTVSSSDTTNMRVE